jgi:hypothetical protein
MGKKGAMGRIRGAIDPWIFPIAEIFPDKFWLWCYGQNKSINNVPPDHSSLSCPGISDGLTTRRDVIGRGVPRLLLMVMSWPQG